jgi:hypothetical protein
LPEYAVAKEKWQDKSDMDPRRAKIISIFWADAIRVICMWWKLSSDLWTANLEAQRMVSEKVLASVEAATTVAAGGSPQKVLRRYRTIMRANTKRLSKKRS